MHGACCWVFEQRRGLFAANEALRSVNMLGVAARRSTTLCRDDDDAHDETAQVERQASAASGSKAGEATQHVHVEPHRIWLAFLDERHSVVPEQRDARGDARRCAAWPTALSPIRRC